MRLALVFLLTTLVATCGQKGPLELPPPNASGTASGTASGAVAGPASTYSPL